MQRLTQKAKHLRLRSYWAEIVNFYLIKMNMRKPCTWPRNVDIWQLLSLSLRQTRRFNLKRRGKNYSVVAFVNAGQDNSMS